MRINRNNVEGLLVAIRCATMINYDASEHYIANSPCNECIFGNRRGIGWNECSKYAEILCRSEMMQLVKNDYTKISHLLQTSNVGWCENSNNTLPDFKKLCQEYELIKKLLKENKNGK